MWKLVLTALRSAKEKSMIRVVDNPINTSNLNKVLVLSDIFHSRFMVPMVVVRFGSTPTWAVIAMRWRPLTFRGT